MHVSGVNDKINKEEYIAKLDAVWGSLPVAEVFKRWQEHLRSPAHKPKTVKLGDLINQLEADGFDPNSINVELTPDMLDLLVFPKSISSTNIDDTTLEVTLQFKAVTPTVEKESIHIDELLVDCSNFELVGFEIESYIVQTVEGIYTFECAGKTKDDFDEFISKVVKGRILNIKETFVKHPTTKYTTFTRILDDYFYIEMHFHNGEIL